MNIVPWVISSILEFKESMQQKFQNLSNCHSARLLHKCTSMPAFSESTNSSTHSIESIDDEYRRLAIKWVLSFHKKVHKDTQYLAIAILNRLAPPHLPINEENYEKVALTCLLLASKMNEIYPPKIAQMIAKCKRFIHKDEIMETEGAILAVLNFQVAVDSTVYTQIHRILGCFYSQKLQECQKLYRMVACNRELHLYGDEIAAYAIIYLIIPDFIRKMKLRENNRIKTLAIKIYNLYTEAKDQYQRDKENRTRAL